MLRPLVPPKTPLLPPPLPSLPVLPAAVEGCSLWVLEVPEIPEVLPVGEACPERRRRSVCRSGTPRLLVLHKSKVRDQACSPLLPMPLEVGHRRLWCLKQWHALQPLGRVLRTLNQGLLPCLKYISLVY